jgi:hypothetical protein
VSRPQVTDFESHVHDRLVLRHRRGRKFQLHGFARIERFKAFDASAIGPNSGFAFWGVGPEAVAV